MTMTKFSRINKQREEITMRVLEDMEKGGNEWKKPWVEASPLPPHNPVSGTQYSGRNFLYTYVYGMMRGYADPRWATEKQIKEMGWKIPENLQNGRGGINDELGVGIEHWGMYAYIPRVKKDGTPLTDKGGTQKFTRVRAVKENGVWGRYRKGDNGKYEFEQLPSGVHPHPECDRYFKVFNLSLIEGVPPLPVPDLAPNDDIEVGLLADDVIASSRCEVFEGSTDGAYYNFVNDKISVPSREAFNSNSSFLASLLHEMGHSTAPALDRQMTGDMRSKEYAHEEIVAELSSIFSSVDLAVKAETDPEAAGYGEHVAYLEFWKGRLDSVTGTDEYEATKEELCDDFFAAASQASQATDFIIDRYEQEVGHPAAGKEIVQKLDMPEKTEQEDRADRSLSHKKETARDASAHMQGDRADLVNMRDENAICQDAQSADLIQERNRLKTAVELIEKEITAYEQRSRDLYLKRATDGMSIDDFNSALSRIRNDVDKLRLKSKRASSELLHLNESIAAESIRMETVLKAADFNHLDKTKVSMLIESVYVHKRDPKSGTQAIDITWKF